MGNLLRRWTRKQQAYHQTMGCAFTGNRVSGLLALALLTIAASAQWVSKDSPYPAYHNGPLKPSTPPLLKQDEWTGEFFTHKYQTAAYQMASAIPDVIYQMPCYCWCDRAMGHKSLHSCFENSHGATCTVCMSEAAFAYEQTKQGKTPAQIRAAIEHGDWRSVDLRSIHMD